MVTPHAALLALRYRPQATIADLTRLEAIPDMYGKWGFRDSVNTTTDHVSDGYLSLDQGMATAALGNALGNDVMRTSFATASFKKAIRPVIGVEESNVSPRGCATAATTPSAAGPARTPSTATTATTRSPA